MVQRDDQPYALGKARGTGPIGHEEREQTLNQLLVKMDGFDPHVGIILMAATNRPEILDQALLRAGRFDRQVLVDRPDKSGRRAILRLHAREVPLARTANLEMIAAMTVGFAGADLANVINEAALLAVRHGREEISAVELQDAVERVVAVLEKKNRVIILSPRWKRARVRGIKDGLLVALGSSALVYGRGRFRMGDRRGRQGGARQRGVKL